MEKTIGMRERLDNALANYSFNLPGAGGLYGTLGLTRLTRREIADAVLEALREPTEEMLEAGRYAAEMQVYATGGGDYESEAHWSLDGETAVWQAMIDRISPPKDGREG